MDERMLKWFHFEHLSDDLKVVGSRFYDIACQLTATVAAAGTNCLSS